MGSQLELSYYFVWKWLPLETLSKGHWTPWFVSLSQTQYTPGRLPILTSPKWFPKSHQIQHVSGLQKCFPACCSVTHIHNNMMIRAWVPSPRFYSFYLILCSYNNSKHIECLLPAMLCLVILLSSFFSSILTISPATFKWWTKHPVSKL